MSDIQLFAKTANYLGFSKSFLMKYMDDVKDEMKVHRHITAFPSVAPAGIYGNGGIGNIDGPTRGL